MLRLRDIMTTDVITVGPETPVREALELFARSHVGGAPVVSNGRVVGVVSANDLMKLAAALPGLPQPGDEREDASLWAETPIEDDVEREAEPASAYFSELWDDAGPEVFERVFAADAPNWNVLEEHDVSEAMTRPPLVTFPPGTPVVTAAAAMAERGIHRVLVMDAERLLGIVSAFDITRAVADGRLVRRVFAFNRDEEFAKESP